MTVQFKVPQTAGAINFGIIEVDVLKDGAELCLMIDQLGGTMHVSTIAFDAHGDILIASEREITPEKYLETLARFLGYTVTPPSTFYPNATIAECEAIILPFLEQGLWVQAIKALREYTGWGLYQAKVFVDTYRPGGARYDTYTHR